MKKAICSLVLSVSGVMAIRAEVPSAMAITNARVVTVSGPILPRANIVMRNGLIEAVGENAPIPADAWVIEGEGLTVYPGLINGLSTLGITDSSAIGGGGGRRTGGGAGGGAATTNTGAPARGPEDRPSTTSWLRAADLVRPSDKRLETARSAGFTTSITFPTRGIFAGQGAVVNLAGNKPGQMLITSPAGQYVSLAFSGFSGYPGSLLGVFAYIRQIYIDADHYRLAKEMYARNPSGVSRPEYDRALEGVMESPRVLLPASRTVDIDRMIHFAAELKISPVLYGVPRGYTAAARIAKAGVPVLVSLKWPERRRDADPEAPETLETLQLRDEAPSTPKALAAAKVKFGFYSDGIEKPADIAKAVKRAIDAGLSDDDAIRAFTLSTAEIFGVADRLGSIEKGKIANLVVTKGNLFETNTKIQYVVIDGVKFQPVPEAAPAPTEETN